MRCQIVCIVQEYAPDAQSVLFDLTNNNVSTSAEARQRPVKKNTLPQLFQVSIPDMMVLFHFLSELIVLLSELLTESLQPIKTLSQH